ncbi:unnamed protein product [Acanthoscelides obtectus]|uniref:Uncharacterized protein n=1 Tax=Acanthoscelides obtectus TaxID=200917 RepID=A0A9P0M490_ACAOB|nr:unnamed protein product [Acanthoscelides obtectus]CAK1659266.1 hypothetical protein AOBTE_LOCUS21377 [Acanthoscelides obtectus]
MYNQLEVVSSFDAVAQVTLSYSESPERKSATGSNRLREEHLFRSKYATGSDRILHTGCVISLQRCCFYRLTALRRNIKRTVYGETSRGMYKYSLNNYTSD